MDKEMLRKIPLLANADSALLDRCVSENLIQIRKYAKGATVHRQNDACDALDIVLFGSLVAYSLSDNGSAVTMFDFKENGMIGANLLFGLSNAYPLNIYSTTASELLQIKRDAVTALLHGFDFVMCYIQSLSRNSLGLNRKITMITQKTLRENILDYLSHQAVLQGSAVIRLPISKKELADNMGVQRPSLFRELKKLKDEGLIDMANRHIKLLRAVCPREESDTT